MTKADDVHSTQGPTAPEIPQGLIEQEARRQDAIETLARLRKEAFAEVDRLIAFLDASDDYVQTELEPSLGSGDDREAEFEDEPSLGWTDREAGTGKHANPADVDGELDTADNEPSLGALEQHPTLYGFGSDHIGDRSPGSLRRIPTIRSKSRS